MLTFPEYAGPSSPAATAGVSISSAIPRPARVPDPLRIRDIYWPDVTFYQEQIDVIYSVMENRQTFVPAGNELGKDFVAAFIVLYFFISRDPVRIITTSVADRHLNVLWGEMSRFLQTARIPLLSEKGGPLVFKHYELRKKIDGLEDRFSYVLGMVAEKPEKMQGHHVAAADNIPRNLFVCDEASGVPDEYFTKATTCFKRLLVLGNTWPCENFFKRAVKGDGDQDLGGDLSRPGRRGLIRKVIKITAEQSPNIRYARREIAAGRIPSNRIIVPGVKSWNDYQDEVVAWDVIQRSVSHDADFYEGPQIKLYPVEAINAAVAYAAQLRQTAPHLLAKAKTIGVDSAMGGDDTAWAGCNDYGLVFLLSLKTPNTAAIPKITAGLMRDHGVLPENVLFDYGGGGKPHVDRMRELGFNVRAVMFGEPADPPLRHTGTTLTMMNRRQGVEIRRAYKNRRAEMYGTLADSLSPIFESDSEDSSSPSSRFALPANLLNQPRPDGKATLRRQLLAVPKRYDEEGRLLIPSKQPKTAAASVSSSAASGSTAASETLLKLIGCSPDEMDALVLANWGRVKRTTPFIVRSATR